MVPDSQNDPLINSQLSHFKLLAKIGEGGMGRVYKAIDIRLQRYVAMKLLSPRLFREKKALHRFQIEAVAASTINHPNICAIYEIDNVDSRSFIAMEYINGPTLRRLLETSGPLPAGDVIWIFEQLCSALQVTHDAGIVHLDIKPDNIMLCREPKIIKITDFGLARLASDTAEQRYDRDLTLTTAEDESDPSGFKPDLITTTFSNIMGTAAYMSPEQVKREAINYRSDIWSLGVLIYELLSGRKLFHGDSQIDVLQKIAKADIDPDLEQATNLSSKWKTVIRSCLHVNPQDRYPSVTKLLQDISSLKSGSRQRSKILTDSRKQTKQGRVVLRIVLPLSLFILTAILFFGSKLWFEWFNQPETVTIAGDSIPVTTRSAQAYNYFLKGREAWWRYDGDTAIRNLQLAVEADVSFAYAQCLLGVLYFWRDRDQEGADCLREAARSLDELRRWEKLLVQGFIEYGESDYEQMLQTFDKLVNRYPDVIDGYLGAALACENLREFDKGIDYTLRLAAMDSSHIAAHGNLADLYQWKGNLPLAIEYAEKYLNLILESDYTQGASGAYEQVGTFYHFINRPQEALKNLQKSLELNPRNLDVTRYLAEVHALAGRMQEAENVFKTALSMPLKREERSNVYADLKCLAVFAGRYSDALAHSEKRKILADEDKLLDIALLCLYDYEKIYKELKQYDMIQYELDKVSREFQIKDNKEKKYNRWNIVQFRLALHRYDWISARYQLNILDNMVPESWLISADADLAFAQGDYVTAEKLYHSEIEKITKPFWGEKVDDLYSYAFIKYKKGDCQSAVKTCHSILQARHILQHATIPVYYIKAIALLSEIYESMGEVDNALAECDRFLMYWSNADPGIPLLVQVEERRQRLLQ